MPVDYLEASLAELSLEFIPNKPLMIDFRKVWGINKSMAVGGEEIWLVVFNASGQAILNKKLFQVLNLPPAAAWVLLLPGPKFQARDFKAIGAWSYEDKISRLAATAIEYQWRCHPRLYKLRLKTLKEDGALFSLSPDFFDIVDKEVFYREEDHRIPLFIPTNRIIESEAFVEIKSYPGRLFGVLIKSPYSDRVQSLRLFKSDGLRSESFSIPNQSIVEVRNYLELGSLQNNGRAAKSLREVVWNQFEELEFSLEQHFGKWKIEGGGTTGHAIGSLRKRIAEMKLFFRNYC